MFTLCSICNSVTVGVYWTLLHEVTLLKHKDNPGRTVHTYLTHSFPAISMCLLWWINEIRLHSSHWVHINVITLLYGVWSYIKFKVSGLVLYHFIDFNEFQAIINILIIALIASVVYILLAKVSYWVKPLRS